MLAAIPADEARILEMFRLALMVANSRAAVSEALSEYFSKVLSQARNLDRDPGARIRPVLPEAIQLALDFRDEKG